MTDQVSDSNKDSSPTQLAGDHARGEDLITKDVDTSGSAKRRPYSVAPSQTHHHQQPKTFHSREPSIDENGAHSSLSNTLNSSFTGSPRKNSFGPSANESRRNSYQMDSRKSTMIGSRRSTMLGHSGSVVMSPEGRRGSFPPALVVDDLDPMISGRSTAVGSKMGGAGSNRS
ncbi:hypothetical protein ElyMa_003136400 [Elysia marginata]|uniref:Uncharacterized protein n=1 Tax=Elysia marginata TaxID=1093978 RepID=A0AAV4IUU9_9GAST|nr:hypothetical protein ElyMa_003136400 [Elysia marginata]